VGSPQRRGLDPYDECFEQVTPRKIDTFSYHETPCRYEPPLVPHAAGPCPCRNAYCRTPTTLAGMQTLDRVLTQAYSRRIKNVLTESSTSVVIRSEQQFHLRDLCRFAQRRHFYEVVQNGAPDDESRLGVGCTKIDEGDRLGEYLGFVDLREHYYSSPIAFGVLVEPKWIREDPSTFVISGVYGPLFGAHSFRSSVYAMQDRGTIGAVCGQMCAIMALGMLADRGIEVKGSFTLTYLACIEPPPPDGQKPPGVRELKVRGLTPEELGEVMGKCGANAQCIALQCKYPWADDLATRIIEANIYARFPVILAVDAPTWRDDPSASPGAHAVTIVGVRLNPLTREPIGFIVHDPGSGPFQYSRTGHCFDASKAHQIQSESNPKQWNAGNTIHMVVAATDSICRHAFDCVLWLGSQDWDPGQDSSSESGNRPERFMPYAQRCRGTDYRIRLLDRESIYGFLGPLLRDGDSEGPETVRARVERLPESRLWFWTVMGFRQQPDRSRLALSVVWLFDARDSDERRPVAKFWYGQSSRLETE
jgi:hypothetical protein